MWKKYIILLIVKFLIPNKKPHQKDGVFAAYKEWPSLELFS